MVNKHKTHSNSQLSAQVVTALYRHVSRGNALSKTDDNYLDLDYEEFDIKPIKYKTFRSWLDRRMVIPETNVTLFEKLKEARQNAVQNKKKQMLFQALKVLDDDTKMDTTEAKIVRVPDSGSERGYTYEEIRVPNPALCKIRNDTARYITNKIGHEHGINDAPKEIVQEHSGRVQFSLVDIARYSEQMNNAKQKVIDVDTYEIEKDMVLSDFDQIKVTDYDENGQPFLV